MNRCPAGSTGGTHPRPQVHTLDRFSRTREQSIRFKALLREHGVMVKSITEICDPETPQGFLYEG